LLANDEAIIKKRSNSRWSLALKSCYYGALGVNVWEFYAYYKLFNSAGRIGWWW